MNANLHQSLSSKPPFLSIFMPKYSNNPNNLTSFSPLHQKPLRIVRIKSTSSDSNNNASSPHVPPQITRPDTVEIRFRRRSKKRPRKESEDGLIGEGKPRNVKATSEVPKQWEEMNFSEKVMELYVGEKGLLFWLNKFAYASIFIVIGGWILFRFVGPSLNLYQLDTPPLSPSSILKG